MFPFALDPLPNTSAIPPKNESRESKAPVNQARGAPSIRSSEESGIAELAAATPLPFPFSKSGKGSRSSDLSTRTRRSSRKEETGSSFRTIKPVANAYFYKEILA